MKSFVLIGNFGDGNFGDEAVLQFYKEYYTEVKWNVLSSSPNNNDFFRLPGGLRSLFTPWYKTIYTYYKSDGVVFAGGTLFTDAESVYACFLWWLHGALAIILRKPIYLAFQGIGPFHSRVAHMFAASICKRAQYISVRDTLSLERVQLMNVGIPVQLVFDPVILLVRTPESQYSHRSLVVIPRNNTTDAFIHNIKQHAKSDWDEVLLLSFQLGNEEEQILLNQLQTLFTAARIQSVTGLQEAVSFIHSASMVLSQRFHGTLIAKVLGKDVLTVQQRAGDKHSILLKEMEDVDQCKKRANFGFESLKKALRI
jgi:polysaccharide pyruvyl transferase WcaK-like protein